MSSAVLEDPDVVTKSRFAALTNVTPGRVTQWITARKISGDALVGKGRSARVRVSVACQQLRRTLDLSQRFGNGLGTDLTSPAPLDLAPPSASPPEAAPFAPSTATTTAPPPAPAPIDPIEDRIRLAKLEQIERTNRNLARQEAERDGRLTDAEAARAAIGRAVSQTVMVFEGAIPEIAAAIAAKFALPPRDLVHLMRGEFRKVRAAAAKTLRRSLDDIPAFAEADIGDPVSAGGQCVSGAVAADALGDESAEPEPEPEPDPAPALAAE